MRTSVDIPGFKRKIEHLVREAQQPKEEKDEKPEGPVEHHYHQAYQEASTKILKELIEPRIDAVAESFENASMEVYADIGYIRLSFSSEEKPPLTYLLFCLLQDHGEKRITVYTESCLRPFSTNCQPAASIVFDLDSVNYEKINAFVESAVLSFLGNYLLCAKK